MSEATEEPRLIRRPDGLAPEAVRSVEVAIAAGILDEHTHEEIDLGRGMVSERCRICCSPAPCEFERWARKKCVEHGSLIYLGLSLLHARHTDNVPRIRSAESD
jgi:hypothetical protein